MKTILLPTDFSSNARHAINYAYHLFKGQPCKFILLSTYKELQAGASLVVSVKDMMLNETNKSINRLYNELMAEYGDAIELEKLVEYGSLSTVISKIEKPERIDLVIMGTKGASGVKEVLMGSNTAAVIAEVQSPVLAIPEDAPLSDLQRIALATDYHPFKNSEVLLPMVELAQRFKSEVLVFHVQKSETPTLTVTEAAQGIQLHHDLESVTHNFSYATDDDVAHGIEQFAETQHINLLTMVAHQHPFFWHLFNRSMTKKMAMHIHLPLLVLHDV